MVEKYQVIDHVAFFSSFFFTSAVVNLLGFFGSFSNAAESDCGFNLIVIDPPWENGSARQKSMYGITFLVI